MALVPLALSALLLSADPKPPITDLVRKGMTMAEVKRLKGVPARISRQILFRRHVEQWRYEAQTGWIEFNCVRGEEAYVSNVHSDSPPR